MINFITMAGANKYHETGSNPYHLNLNNSAKDFSVNDSTNPGNGLLDTLSKFIILQSDTKINGALIVQSRIDGVTHKRNWTHV